MIFPYRRYFFLARKIAATFLAAIFVLQPLSVFAADEALITPVADSSELAPVLTAPESLEEVPTISELEIPEPVELEAPIILPESSKDETAPVNESDLGKGLGGGAVMSFGGGGPVVSDPAIRNTQPFADAVRNRPQADKQSGAMTYAYKILAPEGRNGLTPDVVLQYSSQVRNQDQNWLGRGWSLSIPKIERMTRMGVDNIYNVSKFQSSVSGDLSFVGGTEYGARVEKGDFTKYFFGNNVWTARPRTDSSLLTGHPAPIGL